VEEEKFSIDSLDAESKALIERSIGNTQQAGSPFQFWRLNAKKTITGRDGKPRTQISDGWTSSLVDEAKNISNPETGELSFVVLLFNDRGRAKFPEFDSSRPGQRPTCESEDGVIGIGNPGTVCADCMYSTKTDDKGRKVCSHLIKALVVDNITMTPHVIVFKGGSYWAGREIIQDIAKRHDEAGELSFARTYKLSAQQLDNSIHYKAVLVKDKSGALDSAPMKPEHLKTFLGLLKESATKFVVPDIEKRKEEAEKIRDKRSGRAVPSASARITQEAETAVASSTAQPPPNLNF